ERDGLDEVAVGWRVSAFPVAVDGKREEARHDRRAGRNEGARRGTQRRDRSDGSDEEPGRAASEAERAVEEHRGQTDPELEGDRRRVGEHLRLRRAEEVPGVWDRKPVQDRVKSDCDYRDRRRGRSKADDMRAPVPRRCREQNEQDEPVAWIEEEREPG